MSGSGPEFFQTGMGRKFFEHDVPEIAEALNRLSCAIEKMNELKERELTTEKGEQK